MPTLAEIQDQHRTVVENAEKTAKAIHMLEGELENMRRQEYRLEGARIILEGFLNAPPEGEAVPNSEETPGAMPKAYPVEESEAVSGHASEPTKPRKGKV